MSEENKKLELDDSELEKVSGGTGEFGGLQEWGTQKIGYCKYCGADKMLTYVGWDIGFAGGKRMGPCNKWRCSDCQCDNYYVQISGFLLR